jgi:transcription initiation factor TFIID subunit 3
MYLALLRPPVLHILRAAGFHAARPAALDSMVDLAARYLLLVAQKTSEMSQVTHNGGGPTVTDVRLALEDVGAFRPQISDIEAHQYGDDDLRGIEAFVNWVTGSANQEIRRIAGLVATGDMPEVDQAQEKEDYLSGREVFLPGIVLLPADRECQP